MAMNWNLFRAAGAGVACAMVPALVACGDRGWNPDQSPASTASQAVGVLVINELYVFPPGSENPGDPSTTRDPWWYVELKGTPELDLTGYYLVQVDGIYNDSAYSNTGKVLGVEIDLSKACGGSACKLGTNGLLLLRDTQGKQGEFVASQDPATTVADKAFDAFWPGSMSYLLIHSPSALHPGAGDLDLDPQNGGTLTLPAGAQVIDAVGWKTGYTPADYVYGGVECEQAQYHSACQRCAGKFEVPAAATRLPGDTTPLSAAAWYCGAIKGTAPEGLVYDDEQPYASTNLPAGAVLTPGAENSSGSGQAGAGGSGTGGATGTGGQAGVGGSAGDGGAAGVGGSSGEGGAASEGGAAGSPGSGGSAGEGGAAGSPGAGGSAGSSGTTGGGGTTGAGGKSAAGSGGTGEVPANTEESGESSGCSTSFGSRTVPSGLAVLFGLLLTRVLRRRQS